MHRKEKKAEKPPCSIRGCWQDARTAGLCSACYSGMARMRTRTPQEMVFYQKRVRRLGQRAAAFVGQATAATKRSNKKAA